MNAKNLLKRAACLFSLTGLALSVSAQSRFADAMRQAYAKPERIYQFYVQHQPDSIYKQGEDVFSPYLSSDQFAAQLRAMEERLGDPVEASMWEMQQMAGCEIYSRKITFPRHSATLNVVFDPSGSLLGFTFTDEKALLTETESAHHIYVSDTIQLPARLTMPSASSVKDRVPVVILVHGSGPSNMDEAMGPNAPFRDLAEGLSRRGVAVLRYDKRTFVCPQFFENAKEGYTYDDETVDDALSAIRLVKDSLAKEKTIDPSRIYIVGHSMGGMLAPRIAQRSGEVAGLVLLAAPTGKLLPTIERQLAYLGRSAEEIRKLTEIALADIPDSYLDLDARYSDTATAQELNIPMLILQGERDYQVTMDDYRTWRQTVGNRQGGDEVLSFAQPSVHGGQGRQYARGIPDPGPCCRGGDGRYCQLCPLGQIRSLFPSCAIITYLCARTLLTFVRDHYLGWIFSFLSSQDANRLAWVNTI